jgi:hypothetical protein
MRISGGFVVTALIAAGFALYLTGRDTTSSFDAVNAAADDLRETGVSGQELEIETAARMVNVMDELLEHPDTIGDQVDDLRTLADTAASWAAAAAPASRELHIAVSLRGAAGELREQALSHSDTHLQRARRYLDQARSSLESLMNGDRVPPPQLATDGLRDQLQNLEQAQREQMQQFNEALKR